MGGKKEHSSRVDSRCQGLSQSMPLCSSAMAYFSLLVRLKFNWLPLHSSHTTSLWKLTKRLNAFTNKVIAFTGKQSPWPVEMFSGWALPSLPPIPFSWPMLVLLLWRCHKGLAVSVWEQILVQGIRPTHKKREESSCSPSSRA